MTKFGISSDRFGRPGTEQAYYDVTRSLGFSFDALLLDSRLPRDNGGIQAQLSWLNEYATITDASGADEISLEMHVPYAWLEEEWWTNVVEAAMRAMQGHRSVKYFGLHTPEWFAVRWGTPWVQLTRAEHAAGFQRFNNLAAQYGFQTAHVRGGAAYPWMNIAEMVADIGPWRRWGGYPSQTAGWIWTQYPADQWQYEWVRDDIRSMYGQTQLGIDLGMWDGLVSDCALAEAGKCWNFRNTDWVLKAVTEETPNLRYLLFYGWTYPLAQQTEFRDAVSRWLTPSTPTPPVPVLLPLVVGVAIVVLYLFSRKRTGR